MAQHPLTPGKEVPGLNTAVTLSGTGTQEEIKKLVGGPAAAVGPHRVGVAEPGGHGAQSGPEALLQGLSAPGVLQGLEKTAAALPGGREALWGGPLRGSRLPECGQEAIKQVGGLGLWRARRPLGLGTGSLGSGEPNLWALEAPWLLCLLLISRATSELAPLLFPVFFFLSFRSLF
jgi:hypothetical protein